MTYGIERRDGLVIELIRWDGRKVPIAAWEWQGEEQDDTTEGRHLYMPPKGWRAPMPSVSNSIMAAAIEGACRPYEDAPGDFLLRLDREGLL